MHPHAVYTFLERTTKVGDLGCEPESHGLEPSGGAVGYVEGGEGACDHELHRVDTRSSGTSTAPLRVMPARLCWAMLSSGKTYV